MFICSAYNVILTNVYMKLFIYKNSSPIDIARHDKKCRISIFSTFEDEQNYDVD